MLDEQLEAFANLNAISPELQTTEPPPLLPFKAGRHARRVAEDESMSLHITEMLGSGKERSTLLGGVPHPRVRQEDEPVLLDILDILKANDWKLPASQNDL